MAVSGEFVVLSAAKDLTLAKYSAFGGEARVQSLGEVLRLRLRTTWGRRS
jgi:hypothetical protein